MTPPCPTSQVVIGGALTRQERPAASGLSLRRWLGFGLALCGHLCWATPGPAGLDSFSVDVWQVEEGLPQISVTSITQTPEGYLWLGTFNGLARFDGVRFTVFDSGNTPALSSSRITRLEVDSQGDLWIVTEDGGVGPDGRGPILALSKGGRLTRIGSRRAGARRPGATAPDRSSGGPASNRKPPTFSSGPRRLVAGGRRAVLALRRGRPGSNRVTGQGLPPSPTALDLLGGDRIGRCSHRSHCGLCLPQPRGWLLAGDQQRHLPVARGPAFQACGAPPARGVPARVHCRGPGGQLLGWRLGSGIVSMGAGWPMRAVH